MLTRESIVKCRTLKDKGNLEMRYDDAEQIEAARGVERDDLLARIATLETVLRGDPEMPEQIGPLSWLKEAIKELRARGPSDDCDDCDAFWEMVSECEQLHNRGLAALSPQTKQEAD